MQNGCNDGGSAVLLSTSRTMKHPMVEYTLHFFSIVCILGEFSYITTFLFLGLPMKDDAVFGGFWPEPPGVSFHDVWELVSYRCTLHDTIFSIAPYNSYSFIRSATPPKCVTMIVMCTLDVCILCLYCCGSFGRTYYRVEQYEADDCLLLREYIECFTMFLYSTSVWGVIQFSTSSLYLPPMAPKAPPMVCTNKSRQC